MSRFSISYKASVRQRTHNKKGTNPKKEKTYSYPISPQFKIPQFCQPLQSFYLRYPILHEIDIRQIHQMRNILDMLDLIETQIQTGQVMEIVQALDVRDEIVVEIEVDEVLRDFRWERNSWYLVLAKAYSLFSSSKRLVLATNPASGHHV